MHHEPRKRRIATGTVGVAIFVGVLVVAVLLFSGTLLSSGLGQTVSAGAPRGVSAVAGAHNSQTMPLLRAARHQDPNPARGGGDVTVVEGSALAAATTPLDAGEEYEATTADPGAISLYIVREGDTLSQIAEMFDVSINTIRWANDLSASEAIQPGGTLTILPISGVQHEVEEGDTLSTLAEAYGGDINEIRQFNGLAATETIAPGDTITIPGGELAESAPASAQQSFASASSPAPARTTQGYFTHPLPGGQRTQGLHGYNGVDYAAPVGTPIVAAARGEVIVARGAGWNGGYGNYMVIDHPNGTQTLYSHLSGLAVWGGSVVAGQVIGYVGNTGRSTGPHLHFEVRGAANPF
ncbi:peptidoglycan DD-metalloendopeptidase family protein [Patescibacteria group bacterium]|nr:peptidoglycan DD-metalloendopeptidase family protein [Patescibacteria group bacterium]